MQAATFMPSATLISASLWADMTGAAFIAPPNVGSPVAAPSPESSPVASPKPKPNKHGGFSTGSGFFVTAEGHVITNNHVVEKCSETPTVRAESGSDVTARVLARDPANDLALLKTALSPPRFATLRSSVRLGEGVAAFGFPHFDMLSSSGNFTRGDVTALAGLGDDTRHLQISVPVQHGNSGGPLLDYSGNVVGVVTAKLGLKMAVRTGDLPQNVNFAVKGTILASFLDSNGVKHAPGSSGATMTPPDLADAAKSLSVFITCRSTE